jgi:hypothetical protein
MPSPRRKPTLPAAAVPPDISDTDRSALTHAYKAGLILAWRRDLERGYCLTVPGQGDASVDVGQLTKYLQRLASQAGAR